MKKCPFCAEEIQDEAIFCRYCRRDLPQSDQQPKPAVTNTNISWDGLQDYKPPERDIENIYQRKLDNLTQGEWKDLAFPPTHGFISRHYNGKVTLEEFFELKSTLLKKAWASSTAKTPAEIARWLSKNPPKFKASLFSTKNKWMEIASIDAIGALQISLSEYSKEAIEMTYEGYLEDVLRYAFEKSKYASTEKSPLEKLASMSEDKIFSPYKKIPKEYLDLIIEEAKKYIISVSDNAPVFVPFRERTGIIEDMSRLVDKLSQDYISRRNQQFSKNSPERLFIDTDEIRSAIERETKDDIRYDKGAKAMLILSHWHTPF